jgi:Transposase DDE domain
LGSYVVGARSEIVVALDWTEFAHKDQATIALHLVTGHGRATPLVWKTVPRSELKGRPNLYEDEVLARLAETLPAGGRAPVVADRGFFDHRWLDALQADWGFEYVIGMRRNIQVTAATDETRPAAQWAGQDGRPRILREAAVTGEQYPVATVVCVQAKGMKEPWCLVASDPKAKARELVNHYAKRWGIEPSFRDTKDLRFGMGMSSTHTKSPARRDRLWLLSAFAIALLTLLGAAGESLGYDRLLKANTVKRRTHSLFRQGCLLYDLIPTMSEHRLRPLMQRFAELLRQQPTFNKVFGFI